MIQPRADTHRAMTRLSLSLSLILAGLLGSAAPAAAQSGTYRALGTEPFWSVDIGGGRMVYRDPENNRVVVRTPRAISTVDGRVYRSRRLIVRIQTGRSCSDGMSDRTYADTVRVTLDGRELEGCGGAILVPTSLAETSWEIVSINGRRVPGGRQYELDFQRDRLTGRAGCNSFSGPYRVGRDGFQAGPLAMTRMACPGLAMQHEQAVSRILAGRVRLYYPDGLTMIMRSAAGEIRLRKQG